MKKKGINTKGIIQSLKPKTIHWPKENEQTMSIIYKKIHKKLTIEQHEVHQKKKPEWNQSLPYAEAVLSYLSYFEIHGI